MYFQGLCLEAEIERESHVMVNVDNWLELAWHTG